MVHSRRLGTSSFEADVTKCNAMPFLVLFHFWDLQRTLLRAVLSAEWGTVQKWKAQGVDLIVGSESRMIYICNWHTPPVSSESPPLVLLSSLKVCLFRSFLPFWSVIQGPKKKPRLILGPRNSETANYCMVGWLPASLRVQCKKCVGRMLYYIPPHPTLTKSKTSTAAFSSESIKDLVSMFLRSHCTVPPPTTTLIQSGNDIHSFPLRVSGGGYRLFLHAFLLRSPRPSVEKSKWLRTTIWSIEALMSS